MSRPRLVVHGHFYQPSRIDPETGQVPPDPTAAPSRDWNTRISADCYRPNAVIGNYGRISWDLGPTLAGWLQHGDPIAYRGFVDGDAGTHGMAQPFHHSILPLSPLEDRRTELRWGLRDFELRFGRRATGVWLPETAADLATLRLLAAEGVTHTILAPWQLQGDVDTRRPYRIDLDGGRSIAVVAYDGGLSTSVSFEPAATSDADRFARERVLPRLTDGWDDTDGPSMALIATDGELYGHHQPYRDHFLARLAGDVDLGYDVATLDEIVREDGRPLAAAALVERTSWSCHHGITRWMDHCECVPDGSWKATLRTAFDRLADAIDAETHVIARSLVGEPDVWAARDAYIDVIVGATSPTDFAASWIGGPLTDGDEVRAIQRQASGQVLLGLMAAQRWRLAMFASCGSFWDTPDRIETAGVIRAARYAACVMDGIAGSSLADRLEDDLGMWAENPSARGLRATG